MYRTYMDIIFEHYNTSLFESKLPIEHLPQVFPVNIIANVASNDRPSGAVHSRRHFERQAERLSPVSETTQDLHPPSVFALYIYRVSFQEGIRRVVAP